MFEPGRNCREVAHAERFSVIVDAADYFVVLRQSLLLAKERVMLVGWDFDGRIGFNCEECLEGEPKAIGDFMLWLVERTPGLHIYLLRWDTGALKALLRGSTIVTIAKWALHPRIHLKLDGHHPTGASHHQKMVAIDDCLAFCGGIDMTSDRWDTCDHAPDDARRVRPDGSPYGPWHDATTALCGPAAQLVGDECRDRWARATGNRLQPVRNAEPCWPDGLESMFENVDLAVARSHPEMDDQKPVREIEQLFLDQIAMARDFIYMENQYFASRRIAEAIARRLGEPDGPEVVIINPVQADGWLEQVAMDTARARLVAALRKRDPHGRFAMYHAFNTAGEPIYIHAKISIVDDRLLRIGSANLNNRSMRLDTECDVSLDAASHPGGAVAARIGAIRASLLAEHLGVEIEAVKQAHGEQGGLISAIEALRGSGGRSLRPYEIPDLDAVEEWIAENEVLDPENPEDLFEPMTSSRRFRWPDF